jgi:hypothetical protein
MLDFNRECLSGTDLNAAINELLDAAALTEQAQEIQRDYLGASAIGSQCLRKVQYDWQCASVFPARTKRIFARGHLFEEITAKAMAGAGFRIERGTPRTGFTSAEGRFRGHCDGIIVAGPPGKPRLAHLLKYECIWEHKALGSSGWKKLEKDGLRKAYPQYYDQVQLYMAYLGLDENPALFTAVNADTCHILHLTVPFDAAAAQAASDRAALVIKATLAHELLDRITDKDDDWRCKMCSHKERCWK